MKAIRFHAHGGPEVLQVDEIPRPSPGPNEVLVHIHAVSVNPVDVKYREGKAAPLPMVAGSDFAGIVRETGATVTDYDIGDRVYGTGLHNNAIPKGTYAEYIAVPVDVLAPLPDPIEYDAGAAVALCGVTAWHGLIDRGGLEPGDVCLIHGGNGGVGHVAIQVAAAAGATVIATAAPKFHGPLADLGADTVLDYARDDLLEVVGRRSDGGVDIVLDHRIDEYLQFDIDITAFGGNIVAIDGPGATVTDASAARSKELTVSHIGMDNLLRPELPSISRVLRRLSRLLVTNEVSPCIHKTYDLEEAKAAQRTVSEASYLGKVALSVTDAT